MLMAVLPWFDTLAGMGDAWRCLVLVGQLPHIIVIAKQAIIHIEAIDTPANGDLSNWHSPGRFRRSRCCLALNRICSMLGILACRRCASLGFVESSFRETYGRTHPWIAKASIDAGCGATPGAQSSMRNQPR